MIESPERHLWSLVEPIHALTYFAPEAQQAFADAGLRGFWRGYFAGRAAPLGVVGAGAVTALFHGFHPGFVARAVPDVWQHCPPESALAARLDGIDRAWASLHDVVPARRLRRAAHLLRSAAEAVAGDPRPMYRANLELEPPDEPHLAVWLGTTLLREHRGDGHLVALTAHDLGPCDAHVLRVARSGAPVESIMPFRGWSELDWIEAVGALHRRSLLDDTGGITPDGVELHDRVEATTDHLARGPLVAIQPELAELTDILAPLVARIAGRVVPYPNPMGADRFE